MDHLELIIKENKEFFNFEEPRAGHMDRFLEKLDRNEGRSVRFYPIITAVAASITIFLITSAVMLARFTSVSSGISAYDPSLAETESYYLSESNKNLFNTLISDQEMSLEDKFALVYEVQQVNKSIRTLSSELRKNPGDPKIIHALITSFQTRYNVTQSAYSQLSLQTHKIQKYENKNFD